MKFMFPIQIQALIIFRHQTIHSRNYRIIPPNSRNSGSYPTKLKGTKLPEYLLIIMPLKFSQ